LEYQPQNKYDQSNRDELPANKIDHEYLLISPSSVIRWAWV
jgi:hypothetical protein